MNDIKIFKNRGNVKLTDGNVWKVLLLYALPLFGSAFVQQVYSLVDLLVAGNYAADGARAVEAIGNATVIINILLAFALGANGGCSVIVAKYLGAGDNKKVRETVTTSLIAFAALCAFIMVVGFSCARLFIAALSVPDTYFKWCLDYLYIYIGSLPFVFMYNLGCGICSALGDSKSPFIFLVISSVLNIGLDFLFIAVWHMDVAGAAWATFISQAVSCVLTFIVLAFKMRGIRSEEKPAVFDKGLLKELTVTSIPIILQQSFVSVGNFFISKRINLISEDATAGFTTAFKLIVIGTMSIVAMSNGYSNFASQNRAAGEYERVKKGFWIMLCYAVAVSLIFLAVFAAFPEPLTRIFIQKDKLTDDALAYSVQYLRIVSCFLPMVTAKIIADGAVRGCGGNLGFTVSTFLDLLLRVVLVYVLTAIGWGFGGVCWAWAIGWSISMFIALLFWFLRVKKLSKPPVVHGAVSSETAESAPDCQ